MSEIELGFPISLETVAEEENKSLNSIKSSLLFLDINIDNWDGGLLGGNPIWLVPIKNENEVNLNCSKCQRKLSFLLQIYAPKDKITTAYHRCLYIFICLADHESEVRIIRQQLPKQNEFYPKTFTKQTLPDQIELIYGPIICDQQIIEIESEDIEQFKLPKEDKSLIDSSLNKKPDENDSDASLEQENLNDMAKILYEKATIDNDPEFQEFSERILYYPDQVLRYSTNPLIGLPLILNRSSLKLETLQLCSNCKSKLEFEFQIMPQIFNLFKEKHINLQFDSIFIFSCSLSCETTTKQTDIYFTQKFELST